MIYNNVLTVVQNQHDNSNATQQKNINKVVVIVSPITSHQVSYTYVASHIHTQLCFANCGCPKHRALVVTCT